MDSKCGIEIQFKKKHARRELPDGRVVISSLVLL